MSSNNFDLNESSDLNNCITELAEKLKSRSESFEIKDSGWSINTVKYLQININKFSPLRGGRFIKTPKELQKKKAIINVENKENENDVFCFLYSLMVFIEHQFRGRTKNLSDLKRLKSFQFYFKDYYLNHSYPMQLGSIKKFESEVEYSINVWGYGKNEIEGPLYKTSQEKEKHCNLMLLKNDNNEFHYCYIKNMSRLLSMQYSKKHSKIFICNICLLVFYSKEKYLYHKNENRCFKTKVKFPSSEENNHIIKFRNVHKSLKLSFVFYADIEAILTKLSNNNEKLNTVKTHRHVSCSIGYYTKCKFDNKINNYKQFHGENCISEFLRSLIDDCKYLYKNYLKKDTKMIKYSDLERIKLFQNTKSCFVCKEDFVEGQRLVLDHDHRGSPEVRNVLHSLCNLKLRETNDFAVVFHNFMKYDSHFLIEEIVKFPGKTDVIACNKTNYMSVIKTVEFEKEFFRIKFLDSLKFMPASLDSLVEDLKTGGREGFSDIEQMFDESDFNLITRKGLIPYEYIDSFQKLEERELPSKEKFYSSLGNKHCSDGDYEHVQSVWKHFKVETLLDFVLIYMKSDILLLACVCEHFRNVCMKNYELDPFQFITAPSLSWNAMLKMTGAEIELLTDEEMVYDIQNSVRGGIVNCSKKYAQANNPYMHEGYDPSKPSSYIVYVDINNMYAKSLSCKLPTKNYAYDDPKNWNREKILALSDESDRGCIFTVSLRYPEHLHELHNDLPFGAQSMLSPISNDKNKKLILSFYDKKFYTCHYRSLKQFLQQGLELIEIHKVITFDQSDFLRSYIDFNSKLRAESKNEFERNFYKTMNNCIYGKTLESVIKRVDVKLVTKYDNKNTRQLNIETLCSSPYFKNFKIINENFAAVQLKKSEIFFDRPIIVGFSCLEISKIFLYDHFYGFLKNLYGSKVELLYCDTDSLLVLIETPDFYKDIKPYLKDIYDTFNMPPDNIFGLPRVNNKVVGMWKIETADKIILRYVGLRSKCYAIEVQDDKPILKAKGTNKENIKNYSVDDYFEVLINKKDMKDEMTRIIAYGHELYTVVTTKTSLGGTDTKRFLEENGIDTTAFGNVKIAYIKARE